MKTRYTLEELLYSATTRCSCGAGQAYPLNVDEAMKLNTWVCSRVLLGEVTIAAEQPHREPVAIGATRLTDTEGQEHTAYPFWCYEMNSESQPSARGASTRPAGTHVETEPRCTCAKCGHKYVAARHRPGADFRERLGGLDCPKCGAKYLNADGSSSMDIRVGFPSVVVRDDATPDPSPTSV